MTTNLLTSTAAVGLMLDIETLGKRPDAVAWQTALYGWDLKDPDTVFDRPHHQYLPIQPQLDMIPARKIDASTLLYWMKSDMAEARADMDQCDSEDFDELTSLLRHFLRTYDRYTQGGTVDYELWTRGQFDAPIMAGLLRQSGLPVPWEEGAGFRNLRDLRTLEKISGVSYKDVPQPIGFIKHRADWDCKFQIKHHTACMVALATGKLPAAIEHQPV